MTLYIYIFDLNDLITRNSTLEQNSTLEPLLEGLLAHIQIDLSFI